VLLFFRISARRKYFILTLIWITEVVFCLELFAFLASMVDGNNWSASHYSSVVLGKELSVVIREPEPL